MQPHFSLTGTLLLLLAASPLDGATADPASLRELKAVRAAKSPTIDGELNDAAWQSAPPIEGFTQRDPEEGKPATERTVVRVVYDDEAIYFSARLDDSKPVTTMLGRRDNGLQSDWFRVYLDPHHDRRTGAMFWVNPSNVQLDAVLYNDGWDDPDWDAVWSSATKIDKTGWNVEMRIPYSQLRFPDRAEHVWGVNFIRVLLRNNEQDRLIHTPKNESGFVSRFGELTGINGVHPKRGLELLPYAVTRADMLGTVANDDPFNDSNSFGMDVGADVKYGLTSNLTLTGAINPDFGQVEVDPAVVNLSQFELFFPEKRPFFIEGANLFDFGQGGSNWNMNINLFRPDFFYSRRIGRQPQGTGRLAYDFADAPNETRILGAAKVTGKTASGWTVALFDALTDKERAFFITGLERDAAIVEPSTNYFVGRTAKDLGEKGRVGILFTSVNRDLPSELSYLRKDAFTGGVDAHWFFGKRDIILEGFFGGSLVQGTKEAITETQRAPAHYFQRPDADHVEVDDTKTSLTGWGSRVMLAKQTGKVRFNVQAQSYSPGLETNDLGFMPRTDSTATHAAMMYTSPDKTKYFRDQYYMAAKFQNWNHGGDLTANGLLVETGHQLENFWYFRTFGIYALERYDDRSTRGGPGLRTPEDFYVETGLDTDRRKTVSFNLSPFFAKDQNGGFERGASVSMTYRPSSNINLRLSPRYTESRDVAQYVTTIPDATATQTFGNRYVYGEIDQTVFELGTRIEWTFSSALSFQLYLQPFIATGDYDNFKELARGRTYDFDTYGTERGSIDYNAAENLYRVDPDGGGAGEPFNFSNPDFNFRSIRGSAVMRWEFRPGSALFLVWNENRSDAAPYGDFNIRRDVSALSDIASDDVFLLKVSYWLPM